MNKKHKMLSMLMAAMISVNGVGTLGEQVVLAIENQSEIFTIQKANEVEQSLRKGDKFSIWIYVNIESDDTEAIEVFQKNVKVYVDGAAESYGNIQVQPGIDGEPSKVGVILHDVVYNGKGNVVNVEIGLDNVYKEVAVNLKNIEEVVDAAIGVEVSPSTLNVVAGETQQVEIIFKNNGQSPTKETDIKLSVPDKNSTKNIKIKKDKYTLKRLERGESATIVTTLAIEEGTPRGIHKLAVEMGGATKEISLKVDSNFMPPSLQVNMAYNGAFQENTPQEVILDMTNVGHVAAKNVTAKLTGESVVVTNGSNIKYVENIESGKTVKVPVTLMVTDTSKYTVPLNLELKYIDDAGKEQTSAQTINLSTKGSAVQKEITLITTKEPTGTVAIGQTFDVGFSVTAPDGAENVTLKIEPTGGIVPKTKNLFIEPKLAKGQTKKYNISFVAPQDVKTGTYGISMTASYALNGKDVEVKTYATAFVENPEKEDEEESEGKGKPKVIVGTYATSPVVVKAGEEFVLDIAFLNTHEVQKITNFKANLTVHEEGENNTGSVFTPVGASNTFFIPELQPGAMASKNITMYTLPNAKSKTYEVTLEMSYDDAEGNEVIAKEFIGIPVEQVTKLEVAEVQTEMVEVGMAADMTAVIYNTGKTDISNVMISIEGEGFEVQDGKMFEGLFEKGSDIMYMPTIIPQVGGIITGEIVINYEDVTGVEQNLRHPFEMEVMQSTMPPEGEGDVVVPEIDGSIEGEKQVNWFVLLGGVIGVGGAAGITAIVLKKRRKKLEELELDED